MNNIRLRIYEKEQKIKHLQEKSKLRNIFGRVIARYEREIEQLKKELEYDN